MLSLNVLDELTPSEISALAAGPHTNVEGATRYYDISSGPLLGCMGLVNGSQSYDLGLSASDISLLNGTPGLVAFGLSHPHGGYFDIGFNLSPRMILEGASNRVALPGRCGGYCSASPSSGIDRRGWQVRSPIGLESPDDSLPGPPIPAGYHLLQSRMVCGEVTWVSSHFHSNSEVIRLSGDGV